jgi:hypothetical protein
MWLIFVKEDDGLEVQLGEEPVTADSVLVFLKLAPDLAFVVRPFLG